MPVDPDYEKWAAQHALIDAQAVHVLEFKHEKWGSLWITSYGVQFTGMTETGAGFTAEPVAFQVEQPNSSTTTQQELTIKMDALAGYVMNAIRAMTDADREKPITLVWRVYLDTKPNTPAVDQLDFEIIDISGTRLIVEFRCAATILPNIAAGIRYTIDRFPTSRFYERRTPC